MQIYDSTLTGLRRRGFPADAINDFSAQVGIAGAQEAKLMYGMLYSIKSFVGRISPTDVLEGFSNYKTNKYALHYLETPSGLMFVATTDTTSINLKEFLQQLYSKIWIEYVVRDPTWIPGSPISSDLFRNKLDDFIKQCTISGIKIS